MLLFWVGVSWIVPAVVTYTNGYEGVFMPYLESQRYLMWYDNQYHRLYVPAHTNTGGYVAGVIAGWIYYNVTAAKVDVKKHRVSLINYTFFLKFYEQQIIYFLSGSLRYGR